MQHGSGENRGDGSVEDCPLEVELERLVMKGLSESRRAEILAHLECCFTCNELYQTFASFYLRGDGDRMEKDALRGLPAPLPEPFGDYIIHLTPDPVLESATDYAREAFLILSSLSSSDGKIRGSFFLSGRSQDVFVVLRTRQQRPVQYAPLRLANMNGRFLTDSNGVAVIGKYDPGLFLSASMKLFLPLLEISTQVGINREEEEIFDFERIPGLPIKRAHVYIDEDFALCLELDFDGSEVSRPLSAVCVGKGKPRIVPISKGFAVFEKAELGSPLHIFVYPL